MLNVALTGNVAAGKSSVVEELRRLGATIIDADELVREAQAPGTAVLKSIVRRFGREVLEPDGTLDRAALRARVLSDDAALSALNAIVHPAVRRRRDALVKEAAARGDLIVVSDIPLLFEAGDPKRFDLIVLVDAPTEVRRDRLVKLRNLTEDDATRLIATQLPTARKREASHYVIDNDGTLAMLVEATRRMWLGLRRDAAQRAVGGRADGVLFVARRARQLLRGPVGSAARYADAGLAVTLMTTTTAGADELTAALGLAGVEHVDALSRAAAAATARRVHADAVVVTSRRPPAWEPDAWCFAPTAERPSARLDVRPWRDVVASIPGSAAVDRDAFTRAADRPEVPRADLFVPA